MSGRSLEPSTRKPAASSRRYYVTPFLGANALAAVGAGVAAVAGRRRGTPVAAWTIAGLTHAAVTAHGPRNWPRRDSGPDSVLHTAALGSAALTLLLPASGLALASVAILALGGSVGFTRWYARFRRTGSPALEVGQRIPDVELRRLDGGRFRLSELAGRPAALFFYRGSWCPFCVAQIRAVVADYRDLAARGIQLVMISPQPEDDSRRLAERFEVDIRWLTDPDLSAATALGIADPGGVPWIGPRTRFGTDTVLPTIVVLDHDRTILATDQTDSYRRRPDAEIVLDAIDHRGGRTTGGPPADQPAHPRPGAPEAIA